MDLTERPLGVGVARRLSSHLAAGGLRKGAEGEQTHGMELNPVLLGHLLTNRIHRIAQGRARIIAIEAARVDFGCDRDSFVTVEIERKRGGAARANGMVTPLDGDLDVLWIVLEAADVEQILEASGDDELTVGDNPQVTCSKERAATVAEVSAEHMVRFADSAPIAARDAR